MRRIVFSTTGNGAQGALPVDHRAQVFNVGISVVISATATVTVQYTLDDIYNKSITPTWFTVTGFNAVTTNTAGNLTIPASAIQLVTASNTGTVTLTLLQSSGQG